MNIAKEGQYPYMHEVKNKVDFSKLGNENKDLMSDAEKETAADLYIQYHKNLTDITQFMQIEYAAYQNRINNCIHNRCYDDIFKSRTLIRPCVQQCSGGIKEVEQFVQNQFGQMKDEFDQCMNKTKDSQFVMQSVFKCYNDLNRMFEGVKLNVREELNYYQ